MNEVNWDAVSALAEIVGMLAVVISIMYLAVQVQLSRTWSKKQAFQSYLEILFSWMAKLSTDENTAQLYNAGRASYKSLNDDDAVRFHFLMIEKFACIEMLLEYNKDKLAKAEAVNRVDVWLNDDLAQAGVRDWWKEKGRFAMAQDFVDYVDSLNK